MYAVICNPVFWKEINQTITSKNEDIVLKIIDTEVDIMDFFEAIGRISVKNIIIDITTIQDHKKLVTAIKRYKIKNDDKAQIIIIAPNVTQPSSIMDQLVTMGIYDIINPKVETLEEIKLTDILTEMIDSPYQFKKGIKWIIDNDLGDKINEISKEKNIKAKVEKRQDDRTLTVTKEKIIGSVVIGVVGTMNRIGTTHTVLSLANFLTNSNFKVAIVEFHKSNVFSNIRNNYNDVTVTGNTFELDRITYYPYMENLNVLDVLQRDYNYIILDMGQYSECDINEFKRSNTKILVTGVKDWELPTLDEIIRNNDKKYLKNISYYFNYTDQETFERMKSNMKDETVGQYKCFQAPSNPNPFTPNKDSLHLFKELLKDVLPTNQSNNIINKSNGVFSKAKGLLNKFKKESSKDVEI
ncbi:hypothetical protein [Clostridium estertheticum]|uniref:hypothetical protein n=1 Tax=Clostridium estertheticum TaxID=238834 RepID=UPI001C0AA654|nr:hypothetical protein [Clostridium estertheticum]MBU3173289.1 hypothetical protein [Clostridium estertheticum]